MRRTRDDIDVALVQIYCILAIDNALCGSNECIDGILQGVEPLAMIDHSGPVRVHLPLQLDFILRQAKLLQVAMHLEQDSSGGGFINLTRLQAHDAILEEINLADAVGPTNSI